MTQASEAHGSLKSFTGLFQWTHLIDSVSMRYKNSPLCPNTKHPVQENNLVLSSAWPSMDVAALSLASQFLLIYGALMWLACGVTYIISLNDARTLREVGLWVKPLKFMAATALFAWTTAWIAELSRSDLTHGQAYIGITALLVVTSFFEVAYITYQASQGEASHYNTSDSWHAFMFGLMAIAAVGLTASQGWLAWEIWQAKGSQPMPVSAWGILVGLILTFILSTISGFMLGGNQPPAGPGLPIVGWHLTKDIRPAHFLGVHAQQFIPLWGIIVEKFFGAHCTPALTAGCSLYVVLWAILTWTGLST